MLLTIMAAAIVSWPSPPADLVHPDELGAYKSWLDRKELSMAAKVAGSGCTSVTQVFGRVLGDPSMLHVADASKLEGPVYKESFTANDCGVSVMQNVVVLRLHAGGWLGIDELPGETAAGPLLQRDAYRMASTAAKMGLPATCTAPDVQATYKVTDTKLLSKPQHGVIGSSWQELWTQTACGLDRSVRVTFTLTADGGADFLVSPMWSRTPAPPTP